VQNGKPRAWEVAEIEEWRAKGGEDERNGGKAGKKGQEAPLREV